MVVVVPEELELLDESSFFAQEMMVRLKRNMEKMMSIYLTWFPFCGYRRTQYIPEYGGFYKKWGFYLEGV